MHEELFEARNAVQLAAHKVPVDLVWQYPPSVAHHEQAVVALQPDWVVKLLQRTTHDDDEDAAMQ